MPVTENYIVSARKYRPATFASVVGQKHVTSTLQNAIASNQLAQAFLFCGPRGVGKTTCARILAKTINCTNVTKEIEACNECDSCKNFNDGSSINIIELDAASNNSVDDIRSLVEQINIPPMNGKYKVYIIDEVHMLSTAAFNAFLKTLEEPPKYAKFILATTEKHKILPTILSRCQIFDFHRITVEDISSHLEYIAKKENIQYEKEALDIIAQKSDGALRDALSMFDLMVAFTNNNLTYKDVINSLNILDYDYYFKFTESILSTDISQTLLLFDQVLNKGFEGDTFINGLASHIRNLLVCKDPNTMTLLNVPPSIQEKYVIQASKTPTKFLLCCMDFANTSAMEYKSANNKRFCIELGLLKMCNVMNRLAPKPATEKKNLN
jgi:DNA polymerase-3 subunit gamma/tau